MKEVLLFFFLIPVIGVSAQSNTFPANGNVGIGTGYLRPPGAKLTVAGTIVGMHDSSYPFPSAGYYQLSTNNTDASNGGLTISYLSGNTFYPGISLIKNGNVGIGTTNPQSLLAVSGTITARQVAVTQTGWSDFVFDSSYKRMPLSALAAYTRKYKHLPDIPSASSIGQDGLDLGAMEKLHMQKIEELTLYAIDADKRISQDEAMLRKLQDRLDAQQAEIERLKAQQPAQH